MESTTCLEVQWLRGYLQVLQELVAEVEGAISALTANALLRFQQHVSRQQALVLRLQELTEAASSDCGPGWIAAIDHYQPELRGAILKAHQTLAARSRHYASLLRRAKRTLDLILAGCRIYSSDYQVPAQFQPQHHALSCEI